MLNFYLEHSTETKKNSENNKAYGGGSLTNLNLFFYAEVLETPRIFEKDNFDYILIKKTI